MATRGFGSSDNSIIETRAAAAFPPEAKDWPQNLEQGECPLPLGYSPAFIWTPLCIQFLLAYTFESFCFVLFFPQLYLLILWWQKAKFTWLLISRGWRLNDDSVVRCTAALPEGLGSVPSTHMAAYHWLWLQLQEFQHFHTDTQASKTSMHMK